MLAFDVLAFLNTGQGMMAEERWMDRSKRRALL